jgi:hypothetical protein
MNPILGPAFASHAIALAGTRPSDRVAVFGAGGIDLLIGLCRRGYRDVMCRARSGGPHIPADAVDAVLALAIADEAELAAATIEAGRTLKREGVFLARLVRLPAGARERFIRGLSAQGFDDVSARGDVVIARKSARHAEAA